MGGIGGDGAFPCERPPGRGPCRVEEYEKLMGSMLEEAERRIAGLTKRAIARSRKQSRSAGAGGVRATPGVVRAEVRDPARRAGGRRRGRARGGNQAAARRRRGEGRGDRGVDDQHGRAAPGPRRTGTTAGANGRERTNGRRSASRWTRDPRREEEEEEEEEARSVAPLATTPRELGPGRTKKRDRSIPRRPSRSRPRRSGTPRGKRKPPRRCARRRLEVRRSNGPVRF